MFVYLLTFTIKKSSIHVGKYQFHGSYRFGSDCAFNDFLLFLYIRKTRGNDPSFTVALPVYFIYIYLYIPPKKIINMSPEKGPCQKENSLPTIMLGFWGVLYYYIYIP